jgi:Anti-sigma-K factor rskA
MSSQPHDRIEEMLAVQALGGLSEQDAAELDELRLDHGLDCAECLELEAAYGEVAGRLAFSLEPAAVSAEAADEVLRRAGATPEVAAAAAAPAAPRAAGTARFARPRTRRMAWSRGLVAAAAAVVLLVGGAVGGYLVGRPGGNASDSQALAQLVVQPGTRIVEFHGSSRGTLRVAFNPAEPAAYVFGSELPELAEGKVYELWTFRGENPAPSGTFEARGGVLIVPVSADLTRASAMAVTVERAPGAQRPTTRPILTAPLTNA